MSWIEKIKDEDFVASLVAALPDRPNQSSPFGSGGLSAQELKDHFDEAVIVVKDKLNALIDALGKGDLPVDENTTLSGLIASFNNGTFADETLKVEYGTETIPLQSALGNIVALIAENADDIDDIINKAKSGDLAATDLKVKDKNGNIVTLKAALEELHRYVLDYDQILTEEYEELRDEIYGSNSENPADGTIKKRLNDFEDDFTNLASDLPPRKIEPEPYTLAKRDGEGRIKTSWHNDEASFKAAPDDEAVAMEDVRQFLPYNFDLHMDRDTYVLSFTVKNAQGDELGDAQQVDLPLESVWISAAYDAATKSIVLTQRDGDPVYVDVAAITGGLVNRDDFDAEMAKKVDKITGAWRAYTTDANGNTVAKPLADKPSSGGVVLYNEGGILKTNAPVEDNDAANKKFVEDGLAGKVSKASNKSGKNIPWYDPSTDDEGSYTPAFDAVGGTIPIRSSNGEVRVSAPKKDNDAANKRYVDGKVDPIANDVAVIWDALGGAIEYASIDSTTNPVTVPANALPAATLDKIGTGIKTEVINEAVANTDPSEVTDGFSATCIAEGVYRLNGTFDGESCRATFTLITPIDTSEGETIYVSAELLSGSIVDRNGNPSSVCIGVYSPSDYWMVGEQSTIVGQGSPISEFIINYQYESVSFIDAIIAIHIGKQKQTYGVPVASVKKGAETVYTVPDAIRALTYTDSANPADAMPVYGLAMSDTVYNYLDLENKQYVIKCSQNMYGEIGASDATIDVSAYLTDEDGEITVAAGDKILFADADGNSVGSTVPSTITYIVKKGASQ